MQGLLEAPRNALVGDDVIALIQDSNSLVVGGGVELISMNLDVIADYTNDLQGGSVTRSAFADLHGSCALRLSTNLEWGTAIVRPYMVLSDDPKNPSISARFNLGAYFTSTPKRTVGLYPETFDVTGYDILHQLQDTVGDVYVALAGDSYLAIVEAILLDRGYTKYIIDQTSAATVLPSAKVWALDENIKWINVVNDLLAAIGYAGIWSDWNGYLRMHQYITPNQRSAEWLYTADEHTAMLGRDRSIVTDFYDAPNRWVAVRSNNVDDIPPEEGNGVFTYVNENVGPTSVDARGGRVITRYLNIDVADHASLVIAAQVSIDADLRLSTKYEVTTSPNPLHWHFDRMLVNDQDLGEYLEVMGTQWTLPLNGEDMSHEWSSVAIT